MQRDKVMPRWEDAVQRATLSRDIVKSVPTKTPLILHCTGWDNKRGERIPVRIACRVKDFGTVSIKIELIAAEKDLWPFCKNKLVKNTQDKYDKVPDETPSIKMDHVNSWELLPLTDLPLLMTYEVRFHSWQNF
jgi:hypothetical protein